MVESEMRCCVLCALCWLRLVVRCVLFLVRCCCRGSNIDCLMVVAYCLGSHVVVAIV